MEIWDLYDEQGNKTGETWERSRAKEIPEGRYSTRDTSLILIS